MKDIILILLSSCTFPLKVHSLPVVYYLLSALPLKAFWQGFNVHDNQYQKQKAKTNKQTPTKTPTNQKNTPQNKQTKLSEIRHWILLHTKMSRKLKVRWNFWKQTWNIQAKASPANPKNRHREKLMILTDFCKCRNPKLA